jgi:uncharacterized protein (TIGR03437 family)
VIDQVQIIKSCLPLNASYLSNFCSAAIFHADGKAASSTSPAKAGEVVTLYAYGLGAPDTPYDDAMGTPGSVMPATRPFSITFRGGVTALVRNTWD